MVNAPVYEDWKEESKEGALTVSSEVIRQCPSLLVTRGTVTRSRISGDTEATWLSMLKSVADCMTTGPLQESHAVVHGGAESRALARRALTSMGVDGDRVESEGAYDHSDCLETCEGDARSVRIDLPR